MGGGVVGINERLMTLRLRLNNNQLATSISVYAPTLDAEEDTKEQFYSELDLALTTVPKEDKLILLGDFNASVGHDCRLWNNIIGKEGDGKYNSIGVLLLSKCAEHDHVNTLLIPCSTEKHVQDNMDAPAIQTLAPLGLCHYSLP